MVPISKVTHYKVDGWGSLLEKRWVEIFLFTVISKLTIGATLGHECGGA